MRSVLFTPGSDERKLGRALASDADAVVADLEDAVAPAEKAGARETVARSFRSSGAGGGGGARLVRVNGFDTPYFEEDVAILGGLGLDGVVLPMASPDGVAALAAAGLPIVAVVETAMGVRLAYEIAASPGVVALLLGAVDLGAEFGPRNAVGRARDFLHALEARRRLRRRRDPGPDRLRAPGVRRRIGPRVSGPARPQPRSARQGLHPSGSGGDREPSVRLAPEEVAWAYRVVEAASAGLAGGRGVVALDGAMVDAPVVARARRIIEESENHVG